MLYQIQNKFGGSVKLRAGVKAIRYRLHNKIGMTNLIHAVNGNIRNSKRIVQFYRICDILGITPLPTLALTSSNA
jgi:ubiquinol-cytochrome c reductase cytochrome b subunit